MSVKSRRERIKQIIAQTEVNTQSELAKLLSEEGFSVTQATVSRDIKELGLIKEKGKILNYRYSLPETTLTVSEDKVIPLLKAFVTSVVSARNLVVVKTLEGHGSACGMAIDKLSIQGVLGSIAGDDTLLIVAESDEQANVVKQKIKGYLNV